MLKKLALATVMVLPFAIGSVTANADDRIERQVYTDKHYQSTVAKARQMLQKKGYQVRKIEADDYRRQPSLSVEAYKQGHEYDIKLAYPSLRILKQKIDD